MRKLTENEAVGISVYSGDGNRVSRNIITGNLAGIDSVSTKNSKFTCNQANGNGITGIELLGLAGTSTGNVVRGNVVNNNAAGIAIYGNADDPERVPIPEGNIVKGNIATGNALADLAEVLMSFSTGAIVVEEPCRNTWKKNEFMTEIGPTMCIGSTVMLDDDDVCALDDDDDDDDEDDDDD